MRNENYSDPFSSQSQKLAGKNKKAFSISRTQVWQNLFRIAEIYNSGSLRSVAIQGRVGGGL